MPGTGIEGPKLPSYVVTYTDTGYKEERNTAPSDRSNVSSQRLKPQRTRQGDLP